MIIIQHLSDNRPWFRPLYQLLWGQSCLQQKYSYKIEKYSIIRAKLAIERSDVCVIMIDAKEGVTEQDTKIAGIAHEAGKASVIVINKWDNIEKDDRTMDEYVKKIKKVLGI